MSIQLQQLDAALRALGTSAVAAYLGLEDRTLYTVILGLCQPRTTAKVLRRLEERPLANLLRERGIEAA